MPMLATMCMKKQELRGNLRNCRKFHVIDDKGFMDFAWTGGGKKGELKNEGWSHDVIENKGRVNRQIGWSHDVDENK